MDSESLDRPVALHPLGGPLPRTVRTSFPDPVFETLNMKGVYYASAGVKQSDWVAHADNIKKDCTPEDLLFQVLVDWGVDLALPIAKETIAGTASFSWTALRSQPTSMPQLARRSSRS